jgi:hypothetical protein
MAVCARILRKVENYDEVNCKQHLEGVACCQRQ